MREVESDITFKQVTHLIVISAHVLLHAVSPAEPEIEDCMMENVTQRRVFVK